MRYQLILTKLLWLVPMSLQASIAVAMVVRKQIRKFPVFFCYTLFVPFRDLILLTIRGGSNLYSLIYWIGEGIAIMLGIGLIYEVLWHLTRPYPLLLMIGRRIFWFIVVLACCIGLVMIPAALLNEPKITIQLFLLVELLARGIQAIMLIIFVALISMFDLKWRYHTAGIIVGLGIAAGLQLGLYEIKGHMHGMTDATFKFLAPAGYNVAVIIWALYFLPAHPEVKAESVATADLSSVERMLTEFRAR